MRIFEPITLKWWQVGILKLSMVSIGVAAGATWSEQLQRFVPAAWMVFGISAAYMSYVGLRR